MLLLFCVSEYVKYVYVDTVFFFLKKWPLFTENSQVLVNKSHYHLRK